MGWLREIHTSSRSTLKYPRTMGYLKHCRASSRSGRCSNVKGGSDKRDLGESDEDLTYYHVWHMVEHGLNPPPDGPSLVTILTPS